MVNSTFQIKSAAIRIIAILSMVALPGTWVLYEFEGRVFSLSDWVLEKIIAPYNLDTHIVANVVIYGFDFLFLVAPQIVVSVIFYELWINCRKQDQKEVRCRKCGYILRGLTKPECPECGERI